MAGKLATTSSVLLTFLKDLSQSKGSAGLTQTIATASLANKVAFCDDDARSLPITDPPPQLKALNFATLPGRAIPHLALACPARVTATQTCLRSALPADCCGPVPESEQMRASEEGGQVAGALEKLGCWGGQVSHWRGPSWHRRLQVNTGHVGMLCSRGSSGFSPVPGCCFSRASCSRLCAPKVGCTLGCFAHHPTGQRSSVGPSLGCGWSKPRMGLNSNTVLVRGSPRADPERGLGTVV